MTEKHAENARFFANVIAKPTPASGISHAETCPQKYASSIPATKNGANFTAGSENTLFSLSSIMLLPFNFVNAMIALVRDRKARGKCFFAISFSNVRFGRRILLGYHTNFIFAEEIINNLTL